MITGDALLDFGDGHKIKRSAKPGWYIYHSLPASHQAIFFPVSGLKKWRYDLEYKVSSDYALAAKMYKAGYAFKNSMAWCLNFPWVGYQPPIIWNCVLTPKSPTADITCAWLLGRIILAFTPTYYLKDESLI